MNKRLKKRMDALELRVSLLSIDLLEERYRVSRLMTYLKLYQISTPSVKKIKKIKGG